MPELASKRIVMLTFESVYTKKVGGLAEVPPRLGWALKELGFTVEVFTPSHGVVDACSNPIFVVEHASKYCISLVETAKPLHVVAGGGVLDDPVVYSPTRLLEKSLAFAVAARKYYEASLRQSAESTIFHVHDWHSLPALIALNALSVEAGLPLSFVYHVHLLSKAKIPLEALCREAGICGDTLVRGLHGVKPFSYYYELSQGFAEKLAALVADIVVTVSRGYAKSVERAMGPSSWGRVDYVPNASPITWNDVRESLRKAGVKNPRSRSSRLSYRRKLLERGFADLQVYWSSSEVEQRVARLLGDYNLDYKKPFGGDGPLVFSIGRASKQKGFDILVKALDELTLLIPRIRVVLAAAPLEWDYEWLKWLVEEAKVYEDVLRLIPGFIAREDAIKFYYAANATVVPSRSEPFGLVALESMAAGTPVAASRVDGLADIVLSIEERGVKGTGVLFEPGDPRSLAHKLATLVEVVEEAYKGSRRGLEIRHSCIKRAEEFSWSASAKKATEVYKKLEAAHQVV